MRGGSNHRAHCCYDYSLEQIEWMDITTYSRVHNALYNEDAESTSAYTHGISMVVWSDNEWSGLMMSGLVMTDLMMTGMVMSVCPTDALLESIKICVMKILT